MDVLPQVIKLSLRAWKRAQEAMIGDDGFASLRQSYGWFYVLSYGWFYMLLYAFPDGTAQYEWIKKVILKGKDEHALAFRQAITDECNMTAIAVS